MNIETVFYLIGIPIGYMSIRWSGKHCLGDWTYGDVILCLFCSLFSWVAAATGIIAMGIYWLSAKEFKSKPPKWL